MRLNATPATATEIEQKRLETRCQGVGRSLGNGRSESCWQRAALRTRSLYRDQVQIYRNRHFCRNCVCGCRAEPREPSSVQTVPASRSPSALACCLSWQPFYQLQEFHRSTNTEEGKVNQAVLQKKKKLLQKRVRISDQPAKLLC